MSDLREAPSWFKGASVARNYPLRHDLQKRLVYRLQSIVPEH